MVEDRIARFRLAYWTALRALDTIRLRQWEHSRLTLPQLRILYEVRTTPRITVGELARSLGVTISTASGLVIKLVERGLLERGCDASDRRQAPLALTPAGDALLGGLTGLGRPFLGRVAAELGDELDEITAALERLAVAAERARAEEDRACGRPDAQAPAEVRA
jgi:4'-phosphopantetheinyl transferase